MDPRSTTGPDSSRGDIPEELHAFLRGVGLDWSDAAEITAQSWKSAKRAFRLRLTDGRIAKARLLLDGRSADRIVALLGTGGAGRRCARVLYGEGRCLLEEWVDGESLVTGTVTSEILLECGRALADIHRTPVPQAGVDPLEAPLGADRFRGDIATLVAAGRLTDGEAERLLRIAASAAPDDDLRGMVHLDYCRDNIVLHRDRGPVCIDNETIRTGPLCLDLARSITRWPLEGESRRLFLAGYVAGGGPADPRHLGFWMLVADAWSARLRLEHGGEAVDSHTATLRRWIDRHPAGP